MYLVPVLVWILFSIGSCVGGGYKAITGVADAVKNLERVPAATGGEVDLDEGRNYVYYDSGTPTSTESTTFDPGVEIRVTDPNGNEVPLEGLDGTTIDYSTDDSSGLSIGQFNAPTDGTYQIDILDEPSARGDGQILIGGNVVAGAKSGLVVLVSVGAFGFVVAVIIAIVIARKRGKSKRELRSGYGGSGWPGGGGSGYQPQPAYGAAGGYPSQGGYGAPGSYPPQGGGYDPPPSSYPPPGGGSYPPPGGSGDPPPSSYPPPGGGGFPPQGGGSSYPPPGGGGFPPAGGGYQPPGGFPPSGS